MSRREYDRIVDLNEDDTMTNENRQDIDLEKKNHRNIISRILIIAGVIIIAVAAVMLARKQLDYNKSNDLYDNTVSQYTTSNDKGEWYDQINVDFNALRSVNSDIIAWIHFENEDIDYPILFSGDNDTYLRKTYDGTDATAGSIFMDENNAVDFTDSHILIYGHNMRNLTMFGKLKFYRTQEDYFDNHKYFQIITPEGARRYEVVAYKEVQEDDSLFTIYRGDDDTFRNFVKSELLSDSLINNKDINVDDITNLQMVTLSTCTAADEDRFVVTGVLVDEHPRL
jgi:sortase B